MQFITCKPEGGLIMKTRMIEQLIEKNNMLIKLMGLVLVTALVTNCAPENNQDPALYLTEDSSGIIGGSAADSQFQKQNGLVQLKLITKTGQATCTGTLVSRNVVMTAAHCVFLPGLKDVAVMFTLTDKLANQENTIFATGVVVHEGYVGLKGNAETIGDSDIWNDIALLKLSKDAPTDFKTAQLPPLGSKVSLLKGQRVILAGYGITNAMVRREVKQPDGSTRVSELPSEGTGTLRKVDKIVVTQVTTDQKEITLDQRKFRGACHGDSGGPAFIKLKNGSLLQVGVTSRGTEKLGNCQQGAIYTGVIGQTEWIQNAILKLNEVKKETLVNLK